MDISANRKRNMDVNGNQRYPNNANFIPKYVDRKTETKDAEPLTRNDTVIVSENVTTSCCGIKWGTRYNPVVFNCLAYFGSTLCFLIVLNIRILPDLYYPAIGNLLPLDMHHANVHRVLVITVLWGIHFVRRFGEVLFVHIYMRGMELKEAIGVIIYYCFFGLWIGWSVNFHLGYLTPPNVFFIPGIMICFIGGIGNFLCHLYLREMSTQRYRRNRYTSASHHVMPHRCCFKLVACPHYLFEIITWVGFSLTAFTLASWTFTLVTIIVLVVYSCKRHRAYIKEFDGKHGRDLYPRNRKALIPFVL